MLTLLKHNALIIVLVQILFTIATMLEPHADEFSPESATCDNHRVQTCVEHSQDPLDYS